MPMACAPTVGRLISKVRSAAWSREDLPSRARASRSSSFSLPPSRHEPGTRQSSRKTSAVWEARRPCFLTLVPIVTPAVSGGAEDRGWAAGAELLVDARHHDVDAGDAAVGRPRLL